MQLVFKYIIQEKAMMWVARSLMVDVMERRLVGGEVEWRNENGNAS